MLSNEEDLSDQDLVEDISSQNLNMTNNFIIDECKSIFSRDLKSFQPDFQTYIKDLTQNIFLSLLH